MTLVAVTAEGGGRGGRVGALLGHLAVRVNVVATEGGSIGDRGRWRMAAVAAVGSGGKIMEILD